MACWHLSASVPACAPGLHGKPLVNCLHAGLRFTALELSDENSFQRSQKRRPKARPPIRLNCRSMSVNRRNLSFTCTSGKGYYSGAMTTLNAPETGAGFSFSAHCVTGLRHWQAPAATTERHGLSWGLIDRWTSAALTVFKVKWKREGGRSMIKRMNQSDMFYS